MSEEKSLFTEKELTRLKRPEPPKPGTAFVFVGDGKLLPVLEGERGPTAGELLFGKYSTYYEVDMGDRSLNFHEKLPCADAFEFHAEVKLTYAVSDPVLVVRRARTDAGQFLKDLAIDAMRRASRTYKHEQTGDAEDTIKRRIEDEVRDHGFKLSRSVFVKLSLPEEVQTRLVNRKLGEYDFEDQKTQISRNEQLANLKQKAKLDLKKQKANFFEPYIKAGDWASLLGMLDPSDPEDAAIRAMIKITLNGQIKQEDLQEKLLEIVIEKGAIEGWDYRDAAKALFQKVSGLSEHSIALLEGKSQSQNSEDSQQTNEREVKPSVPDEFSRNQDE
jgi:hypothetical protein